MKKNIILIQIGFIIFILMFPLSADLGYRCEDDESKCSGHFEPPASWICEDWGDCQNHCVDGDTCYHGYPSWPMKYCALVPDEFACKCYYKYKDEGLPSCASYKDERPTCYFSSRTDCTGSGWECEYDEQCEMGDCCQCGSGGCVNGPDALCPLQYCGGLLLGDCTCQGCNLNSQSGNKELDFDCDLSGTHHFQNGNLTISPSGTITMFAGTSDYQTVLKFDNNYSIKIKRGGHILISAPYTSIEKQY